MRRNIALKLRDSSAQKTVDARKRKESGFKTGIHYILINAHQLERLVPSPQLTASHIIETASLLWNPDDLYHHQPSQLWAGHEK